MTPLTAYLGPDRHYHNLAHVGDLLKRLSQVAPHFTLDYCEELIAAIIYHDCVYVAGAKDNEERSAQLAVQLNPHLNAEVLNKIIMATLHTGGALGSIEERLMVDLDLSGFAEGPESLRLATDQICKEYRMEASRDAYNKGRAAFLQTMLQREHIYYTQYFRDNYEALARKTIQGEIEFLTRGF